MALVHSLVQPPSPPPDLPKFPTASPKTAATVQGENEGEDGEVSEMPGGPSPRFDEALDAARKPLKTPEQDRIVADARQEPQAETKTDKLAQKPVDSEAASTGQRQNTHQTPKHVLREPPNTQPEADIADSPAPSTHASPAFAAPATQDAPEADAVSDPADEHATSDQADTDEIRIIMDYAEVLPQMMPVVLSALDVLERDSSGGGGGANPPARTMQTKPSPTAAAETTSTPTTPTPATPTHMHSQTLVTSQSPAPVPPHPMQAQTVMPLSTQLETPPATASTSTPDGAVPQTAGTSPTAENPLPPNVSVFQERLPRSMPGNSFSPSPAGRSETTLPDGRVSDRSTRLRGVSEKTSESENPEVPTAKVVVRESSPLLVDKKSAEEVQSSQSAASRIVQLPQPDEADDLPQRAPANREKAQTFADTIKRVTKPESGETAAPSNDTKRSPTERPPAMQPVPPQAASNLIASSANASAHTANVPQEDKSASPLPSAPIPSATTLTLPVAASPNASTEGAESATPAQQLPPEQGDPTFEQVVLGLRGKLDAKNGKAEIRLDPPNLGTLHVSLRLSNGTLTAEFTSPSDVVRDLLQSHMEKLKNVLEGQGVAVDKLAVESPAPAPGAGSEANSPFADASNHDGRSAGNFGRDSQPGHRQPQQGAASQFARMFQNSLRNLATPVDVIA